MKSSDKSAPSELTEAAQAFENELKRFEQLAESVQKAPLRTEKNLERAAQALQEVAHSDSKLVSLAQQLLQAFNRARERQVEFAGGVNARAEEIEARSQQLQALMGRFSALGAAAGELNRDVQELAVRQGNPGDPDGARALMTALSDVQQRMTQVAEQLSGIVADAEMQEFPDVGRNAESLRQQMLAARNKMGLLQRSLENVRPASDKPLPN